MTKTVPWGQYSGIIKIIPPAEWKDNLPPIPTRSLANVRIKNPIQQNMLGQAGLFRQTNVEKSKAHPLTIQEWFEKCNDGKFVGPGPKDLNPTLDRDSAAAKRARWEAMEEKRKKRDEAKEKRKSAADRRQARASETAAPSVKEEPEAVQEEMEVDKEEPSTNQEAVPALDSSRGSTHSSPDPLAMTPETDPEQTQTDPERTQTEPQPPAEVAEISEVPEEVVVPTWYEDFKPDSAWLPKETQGSDYTVEACANIERKFWKNVGLGEPSWYGADLQGTLFPDPKTPWNVAHLPNLLNRLGRELPGVNRPYLYFGMWRAAFAWHVEDVSNSSLSIPRVPANWFADGPVFYQLYPFWRTEVLVCYSTRSRRAFRAYHRRSVSCLSRRVLKLILS